MSKLTAVKIKALLKTGKTGYFGDGLNLYLQIQDFGRASWIFRYMRHKRSREMGLGKLDLDGTEGYSIAQARARAAVCRQQLRDGLDPIEERDRVAQAREAELITAADRRFEVLAEEYHTTHAGSFSNEKHSAQWLTSLRTHAFPKLGSIDVAAATAQQVADMLELIWSKIPETASRVRGRVETVFDYAKAKKMRVGENPAVWKGNLEFLLPAQPKSKRVKHHPSLPWQKIPAFMVDLAERDGASAHALELLILTAKRTEETIGACSGEFDLAKKVWKIPAERMKGRREHTVTLSRPAVRLLRRIWPKNAKPETLLFPSPDKPEVPISNAAMDRILKKMRSGVTVHGFRSSFRTWVQEATDMQGDIAEAALAHIIGDKTEAAYARGEMLVKRAAMTEVWGAFCVSKRK